MAIDAVLEGHTKKKKMTEQAKAIFVWYPKARIDLT